MKRSGSLLQSYLTTRYRVCGAPLTRGFELRIGVRQPLLAALQSRTRTNSSAFITAWNPHSAARPRSFNEIAQCRLLRELQRYRCKVLCGEGEAENGMWKEPSVLALGLRRDAALRLARRYKQNAVVVCDKSGTPRLVLLRAIE